MFSLRLFNSNGTSKVRLLKSAHPRYGTELEAFTSAADETQNPLENKKEEVELATFSSSVEPPSDEFVQLDQKEIPSHGEVREYMDRQLETVNMTIVRRILGGIFLLFGSASDTVQFYDGVKSFPSILPWLTTALYGAQDLTVTCTFTDAGADAMLRLVNGERSPDWEELSKEDENKARILSILTNAYALFSDATATAYYLTSSNLTGTSLGFILGIFTALFNIPTEGLGNYLTMRSLYTKTEKTLENAFNLFLKSPDYDLACYSKRFKENLPEVWAELSIYLKIVLQNPANKKFLNEDGIELENALAIIFLHPMSKQKELCDYLVDTLKFDKDIAEGISGRIINLQKPGYQENSQAYNFFTKAMQIMEKLAKLLLKIFGASQDVIGSFVSVSAMFAVSSPVVKFILLTLSLANGINDVCFSGKNSETAIDIFKQSLNESIGYKQVAIFALSLLSGSIIGYAQFNLILEMLRDPDSTLPAPLPETLPNEIAFIIALGAAFREATVYSYYFSTSYEDLVRILANCWNSREYKALLKTIDPGFETEDDFELVFDIKNKAVVESGGAVSQEPPKQIAAQASPASPTPERKDDVDLDEQDEKDFAEAKDDADLDKEDEEDFAEAKKTPATKGSSPLPRPSPLTSFSVLSPSPFNPTAAVSKLKSVMGGLRILSPSQ